MSRRPSFRRGPGVAASMALVLVLALLAACGKKGPPVQPGPADQIIYPHQYPKF